MTAATTIDAKGSLVMKTETHGQHLVRLTRRTALFPVNCYLVREDDGLTLIDTALPGCARDILAAARDLGAPIRHIALTHAHGDHAGSLDALRAALPDAEIIMSAREAHIAAGDRTLDPTEPQTPIRGSYPRLATRPTRSVEPGDRIGSLLVVAAPGHTPGQIAFLDTRDDTLIAGDALSTHTGIAVSGIFRPLFPFVMMATWHKLTALQTARTLRALAPSHLAVGHGPVLAVPAAALDSALAEAARRWREARDPSA
jgi:glyoxylase-like metal-dependent hydrolase (beta-lactamase superfamily II)